MQYSSRAVILLLGFILSACSTAQEGVKKGALQADAGKANSVTWYDGKKQRTAWIAPNLIADFSEKSQLNESNVLKAAESKVVFEQKQMRILQVAVDDSGIVSQIKASDSVNVSPVFHDTPSSGAMKALPGGVVLVLNPKLTQHEVDLWFADKSLVAAQQFNFAKYAYLVNTKAGLPSLELANRLMEEDVGEVKVVENSSPNWWQQRFSR